MFIPLSFFNVFERFGIRFCCPGYRRYIYIGMFKLFILLYADDIVIFSYSSEGLQNGLNYLATTPL